MPLFSSLYSISCDCGIVLTRVSYSETHQPGSFMFVEAVRSFILTSTPGHLIRISRLV